MQTCRHCNAEVRNPLLVNNLPYCNSDCRAAFTRAWKERGLKDGRPKPEPPKPAEAIVDWLSLPLIPRADYLLAHGPQIGGDDE